MAVSELDRTAWLEPGAHQVAPGVHRIPCPLPNDGLRAVNVYVLEQPDGLALIDTGFPHPDTVAGLEAGLAELGAGLGDVRRAICTHAHYDHWGFAGELRRISGAELLLGRIELGMLWPGHDRESHARWIAEGAARLTSLGAADIGARLGGSGAMEYDSLRSTGAFETPDRVIEDGEEVEAGGRVLRAVMTPGHTRGHLMFHDEAHGVLFAGDHLLPHITPSLGFEPSDDGRALERFLDSLARTREIDASVVLPGHGPVFTDVAGRVDELIEHHRVRLDACLRNVEAEPGLNTERVAAGLTWTRRETPFEELKGLNRMLAVTETATHLELLRERGLVERFGEPVLRWRPASR